MRRLGTVAALLLAAALACKDEPKAPEREAEAPPRPPPAFTLRDLALATALDAKLASLTLAASDVQTLVQRGAAREKAAAKRLLPKLRVARAEVDQAVSAVSSPADGMLASRVGALAGRYADALDASFGAGAPPPVALVRAERELGEAIDVYRRSRGGWRLEVRMPRPFDEREFDESRRELEGIEAAPQQVAPATLGAAVRRAAAAVERLPPALRAPAARYTRAQEKALSGLRALSQAADAKRTAAAARTYHAAKAEALAALADYHAARAP